MCTHYIKTFWQAALVVIALTRLNALAVFINTSHGIRSGEPE